MLLLENWVVLYNIIVVILVVLSLKISDKIVFPILQIVLMIAKI